jgi:hypothetical protein
MFCQVVENVNKNILKVATKIVFISFGRELNFKEMFLKAIKLMHLYIYIYIYIYIYTYIWWEQ